jgi:hypothetical protein
VTPEVAATSTGKGQPRRPRAAEAPPMAGAVDDDRPTVPDDLDLPDRFE